MSKVNVVSIAEGEYYFGASTSGSTVDVTLERDGRFAKCEGILIWDEDAEEDLSELFDEWLAMADAGEEGYTAW